MPGQLLTPPLWWSQDRNLSPPISSEGHVMPQFPNMASQMPLPSSPSISLHPQSLPSPYEESGDLSMPLSMSSGFDRCSPSFDYKDYLFSDDFLPKNLCSQPYQTPAFPYVYGYHCGSSDLEIDMYEDQFFQEFDQWILECNEHLNHNQFPRVNSSSPSSGIRLINCNYSEERRGNGPNLYSTYSTNGCGNYGFSAQNSHLPNLSAEMECTHRFSALPADFTPNIWKLPTELDAESFWGKKTSNSSISKSDFNNYKDSSDVLKASGDELDGFFRDLNNVTDYFAQILSGSEAQKHAMKNAATSNHSSCTECTEGDQLNYTASLISSEQGSDDRKIMPLQKCSMAAKTAVIDNHSTVIHDGEVLLNELDEIIFSLKATLAQLELHFEIHSDFSDEVFPEKNPAVEIIDHSVKSKPVVEESKVLSDDDETEESAQDSNKSASTKSSCNSDSEWEII